MRHYELMVILDPELEERTVAPSLDRFLNVVRKGGGSVENVNIWGRRKLAYEIKKKTEGIYAVVDMQAEPDLAKELDRQLNLNEAVLRTKLIRPEAHRSRRHSTKAGRISMAGETVITIIGNLTNDPELRFTPSGAAVANFTVASTPRTFDRQSNEWKDGETLFMRCSVWREAAENVAESLTRGTRVIVSGRLRSRTYDTKEGEKRTVVELEVDEVGPSLRYATAKVSKTSRGGGGGGGFGGGGGNGGGGGGFGGGNAGGGGGGYGSSQGRRRTRGRRGRPAGATPTPVPPRTRRSDPRLPPGR